MNKLKQTLLDIDDSLKEKSIPWLLTRYIEEEPSDLDVLVHPRNFNETILALKKSGYKISSHDHALGGRLPGMQVNCTKRDRIKIDLHQEFTWRKSRYISEEFAWDSINQKVSSIRVKTPKKEIDAFIILINLIFEKAYINSREYEFIKSQLEKIESDKKFSKVASQYGWLKSLRSFIDWIKKIEYNNEKVIFLPITTIALSYLEKALHDKRIDPISLSYYIFFRTRYFLKRTLPYE